ncbi:L-threonylcarbamoyladenylate synthase [Streptacidiphilus sp. MAP12-33]|uniref:L-threonylcarbamoyladenylate synthase n=1 Tax=Streptacidiphilus sp. MAP12-33 TaxID=3156266 RepID=UPI0035134F89
MRRFDCSNEEQREAGLREAAAAVKDGRLVVLPTDTVYGVGGDAFDPAAVNRVLAAKGRGRNMPSPVLVGGPEQVDDLAEELPAQARELMSLFWPGGLTLIVRHRPSITLDVGDTGGTVGIRMPDHPVALDLLRRTGPMAVSSANLTGRPSPQDCDAAQGMLGDSVAVYLDGGATAAAVPSSIVDLTCAEPVLLRAGAITLEELRRIVPTLRER